MYNRYNRRKGVKATQLVCKGRKVSLCSRSNRVFQINGVPGYFSGGTVSGTKYNFTYSVEHPDIESGLDKVRFQVYDNADKSKIYATNFEKVSALASEYYGVRVYCYNEVEKKNRKQEAMLNTVASVYRANESTHNKGIRGLINRLFKPREKRGCDMR